MNNFVLKCFDRIVQNIESDIHVSLLLRLIKEQIFSIKRSEEYDVVEILMKDLLRNNNITCKPLTEKFELLSEMLKIAEERVTLEQFEALWNIFINAPGRGAFLNWVYKKKDGKRIVINSQIQNDIRSEIFRKLWPTNEIALFSSM